MTKTSGKTTKPKKPATKKKVDALPEPAQATVPKDKIVVQSAIPGVFQLFVQSLKIIGHNRGLFIKIGLLYGMLSLILQGQGLFSVNNLGGAASGSVSEALMALGGGSDSGSDGAGGALQFVLVIITSLALIWSLRQIHSGHRVKAKEAFYRSTTPFVPFVLTMLVIAIQLLPFFIGATVYQVLIGTGIVRAGTELVISLLICLALAFPSLYLTTASFFAPYIVTLPGVTPFGALRSARELVYKRRLRIFLRLLVLPVFLGLSMLLLLIPVIVLAPVLTPVVYFLLSSASLIFLHTYMYTLYWGLLDE